jgi:1-acyl-sn-glycerol-3-phosphate acyltransferase
VRSHADDRKSGSGDAPHDDVPASIARPGGGGEQLKFDADIVRASYRWLLPLRDWYFRGEVEGLGHIPDEQCLLVANHDGGYFPPDGILVGMGWHERFQFQRPLYWLMHDFPFRIHAKLSEWLNQHGVLPASKRSLDRVFDQGGSAFVYPGGAFEAFRPYRQRRTIELGHRTGFIAAALKRRVPIVPVVSVGAHETLFVLSRGNWLARRLPLLRKFRSDVLPLWVGLPWGIGFGPLPHLPLPSKVKVEVLEPVRLWKELGEAANVDDPAVLRAGLDLVRGRMQSVATRMYAERRWPILG